MRNEVIPLEKRIRQTLLFQPRSDERDDLVGFTEFLQTTPELVKQICRERVARMSEAEKLQFIRDAKHTLWSENYEQT